MARRRHKPEQIIRKLRQPDRLLGEGADISDAARHLEVSEATYQSVAEPVRRHEGRRRQAACPWPCESPHPWPTKVPTSMT